LGLRLGRRGHYRQLLFGGTSLRVPKANSNKPWSPTADAQTNQTMNNHATTTLNSTLLRLSNAAEICFIIAIIVAFLSLLRNIHVLKDIEL
jgi:hypothetical protein